MLDLRNAVGGGWVGVRFPGKRRYVDVRFNVISDSMRKGGCRISTQKKLYVTSDRPLSHG